MFRLLRPLCSLESSGSQPPTFRTFSSQHEDNFHFGGGNTRKVILAASAGASLVAGALLFNFYEGVQCCPLFSVLHIFLIIVL